MKSWKKFAWLLLVPALAAMLVACGGGDDDDDDSSNDKTDSSDSKNDDDDKSSGNATSADKKYVGQICKAMLEFQDDIEKASTDIDPKDLEDAEDFDFADLFVEPVENLIDRMEDADPPKDMKKYHEDSIKQLKDAVKKLKDGDVEAFDDLGDSPLGEPDQDIQDRMDAAAAENDDCVEAGMTEF